MGWDGMEWNGMDTRCLSVVGRRVVWDAFLWRLSFVGFSIFYFLISLMGGRFTRDCDANAGIYIYFIQASPYLTSLFVRPIAISLVLPSARVSYLVVLLTPTDTMH